MAEEYVTMYHGTPVPNLERILREGLRPGRIGPGEMIDRWLAEENLSRDSLPRKFWYSAYKRLLEGKSRIFLSSDEDYAAMQGQAGNEAKILLLVGIYRYQGLPKREAIYAAISDVVEPEVALLTLRLPRSRVEKSEEGVASDPEYTTPYVEPEEVVSSEVEPISRYDAGIDIPLFDYYQEEE